MRQKTQQTATRLLRGIVPVLLCTGCISGAYASDFRWGFSDRYYYPNDNFGIRDNFRLHRDMDRLNDQIQRQQWQLDDQTRQQREQTRLLRQQQSAQLQVTARQACYYRFNGGLDLCERLFAAASEEHARCYEEVVEMNPGCAGDLMSPGHSSAD